MVLQSMLVVFLNSLFYYVLWSRLWNSTGTSPHKCFHTVCRETLLQWPHSTLLAITLLLVVLFVCFCLYGIGAQNSTLFTYVPTLNYGEEKNNPKRFYSPSCPIDLRLVKAVRWRGIRKKNVWEYVKEVEIAKNSDERKEYDPEV